MNDVTTNSFVLRNVFLAWMLRFCVSCVFHLCWFFLYGKALFTPLLSLTKPLEPSKAVIKRLCHIGKPPKQEIEGLDFLF